MRKRLSGRLLRVLEKHDVKIVRRIEATVLQELAADSFGIGIGKSSSMTAKDPLKQYAEFTVRCMESGDRDPEKLYSDAFRLGETIRQETGFTDRKDLMRLIEYLYRNIDIRLRWIREDELVVSRCYFSSVYSPEQCRIMSNADSGIIGGILGSGYIDFSERITEGCGRCKACLKQAEKKGGTK